MSALAAFNPDKFVTPSAPIDPAGGQSTAERTPMPLEWTRGLARLREMPTPRGATEWRWRQVVADSLAFAKTWHLLAVEYGWSIGNLFGFDPWEPAGLVGLVLDIRGGAVVFLTEDVAKILRGEGTDYHKRLMPDDSEPLWKLRTIER